MMEFERRGRLRSLVWDGAVCLYLIVSPLPGAIVVRLRARGGVRGSLTTTGGWEDHDVGRMTLDLIGVEDMRIEGAALRPMTLVDLRLKTTASETELVMTGPGQRIRIRSRTAAATWDGRQENPGVQLDGEPDPDH